MTVSMTGFAAREGALGPWRWTWDIRSVNGRGLDVRLRLPEVPDGLETPVRSAVQARIARGNVTVALKLARDAEAGGKGADPEALRGALGQVAMVQMLAAEQGMDLAPVTAADVISLARLQETGNGTDEDMGPLREAVMADLAPLLDAFVEMRASEGAALAAVISAQVDGIAEAVAAARALAGERAAHMQRALTEALERITGTAGEADPDRVAQELALIAVKTDVAEELDRLDAHVDAARALLAAEGPKGRKLDFLTQEFNREANTLGSKAQYPALTRIGLDLKAVIDQMREQVQNVE